jgi:uncharacterized DUF497 family protein
MQGDGFEWDDDKAVNNKRDHKLTFEMAQHVFKDVFAIMWADNCQGTAEERFVTIGMAETRVLYVSYTLRGDRIRIISARPAEPFEQPRYQNENRT